MRYSHNFLIGDLDIRCSVFSHRCYDYKPFRSCMKAVNAWPNTYFTVSCMAQAPEVFF